MVPHLLRAQSIYKDINYKDTLISSHTRTHTKTHTQMKASLSQSNLQK